LLINSCSLGLKMSILSKEITSLSKPASVSLVVSRWLPFYIVLLTFAWLPFENIAVALWVSVGLPPTIGNLIVWAKEIALLAVFGLALLGGAFRRWRKTELLLLCFVAWVFLYLPVGSLGLTARLAGARMLLWPLLMYLIGRSIPIPPNGLRRMWNALVVVFLVVALAGFFEVLFVPTAQLADLQAATYQAKGLEINATVAGLEGSFYSAIGSRFGAGDLIWFRRMVSTYLEPLALGHALVLPIVFLFYAFAGPRPALLRPRWLVGVLLGTLILAQILAASRGAILAVLIGIGIIIVSSRKARLRSIVVVGVVLAVALTFAPVRDFVLNTITLEDPSSGGHVRQLELGIQLVINQPMGLGLGQGGYVGNYLSEGAAQGTGESFFFAMASQVGVVGVALFVLGLLAILSSLWRVWRKTDSVWLKVSALVTLGALLGYSVSAIASESAFGLLSSGTAWFMSGLVVRIGNRQERVGRGFKD
jgi:hypothetical protein